MIHFSGEACGPYGHDIHLREICAAWKRPPVTEMTRQEYESWLRVEQQVRGRNSKVINRPLLAGASSPPRQPRQLPWLIFETI